MFSMSPLVITSPPAMPAVAVARGTLSLIAGMEEVYTLGSEPSGVTSRTWYLMDEEPQLTTSTSMTRSSGIGGRANTSDFLTAPRWVRRESATPQWAGQGIRLNAVVPGVVTGPVLLWLANPANAHTTGQTIVCDGGADMVLRGDDVWAWNDTIRD